MSIEFLKIMAWRNYLAAHPNVFEACKFYDMDKIVKRIAARPHNEINYLFNLLQQQSDTLTRYPPAASGSAGAGVSTDLLDDIRVLEKERQFYVDRERFYEQRMKAVFQILEQRYADEWIQFLELQQLQHLSYNNYLGPGPAQVQSINASDDDDDVQGTMNNANPDPNNASLQSFQEKVWNEFFDIAAGDQLLDQRQKAAIQFLRQQRRNHP